MEALTTTARDGRVLTPADWHRRRSVHEARVDALVAGHLARRRSGIPHPVEDFLFTYYSHRPAALRRWHPGVGVALEGGEDLLERKGYGRVPGGVGVMEAYVATQQRLVRTLRALLVATAGRAPRLSCFGMHEWAMVYRQDADEVRHDRPLRLGPAGTDRVVERHRIACTHFDAFRFFTDEARPLNDLAPRADDRPDFEQPGCLHAGMDLYKHAYRLSPMVPSELVVDCFELAREIRTLDMRASPYDLGDLGYSPVRVETPEGKQEYAAAQRDFADRAAPLRQRLIDATTHLLRPL